MVMDKCQICSSKSEHTHHIKEQKIANENNIIEHFHKNIKHNLVQLCESCHYKVHNGNLRIIGYEKTNNVPSNICFSMCCKRVSGPSGIVVSCSRGLKHSILISC